MNKEIDRLNNELEEKKRNEKIRNEIESGKETALTEVSKFEWKEKTCEDIIEDMRKIHF